jgi:hypothetical protein
MNSVIFAIAPQVDGRVYITEHHTDQFGLIHTQEYLSDAEADHTALLSTHAAQIGAQLRQSELDSWLSEVRQGNPIPADGCKYVTRDEAFAHCFRTLVFDPDVSALYPAAWMVPYFADEEFTAMGFTGDQIATIRATADKLTQAKALLDTVVPLEA